MHFVYFTWFLFFQCSIYGCTPIVYIIFGLKLFLHDPYNIIIIAIWQVGRQWVLYIMYMTFLGRHTGFGLRLYTTTTVQAINSCPPLSAAIDVWRVGVYIRFDTRRCVRASSVNSVRQLKSLVTLVNVHRRCRSIVRRPKTLLDRQSSPPLA